MAMTFYAEPTACQVCADPSFPLAEAEVLCVDVHAPMFRELFFPKR